MIASKNQVMDQSPGLGAEGVVGQGFIVVNTMNFGSDERFDWEQRLLTQELQVLIERAAECAELVRQKGARKAAFEPSARHRDDDRFELHAGHALGDVLLDHRALRRHRLRKKRLPRLPSNHGRLSNVKRLLRQPFLLEP